MNRDMEGSSLGGFSLGRLSQYSSEEIIAHHNEQAARHRQLTELAGSYTRAAREAIDRNDVNTANSNLDLSERTRAMARQAEQHILSCRVELDSRGFEYEYS